MLPCQEVLQGRVLAFKLMLELPSGVSRPLLLDALVRCEETHLILNASSLPSASPKISRDSDQAGHQAGQTAGG